MKTADRPIDRNESIATATAASPHNSHKEFEHNPNAILTDRKNVLQELDRNPFRRPCYGKHGIRIGVPRRCQRSKVLRNWTILLPCDRPLPKADLRKRKQETTNGPHGPAQHQPYH